MGLKVLGMRRWLGRRVRLYGAELISWGGVWCLVCAGHDGLGMELRAYSIAIVAHVFIFITFLIFFNSPFWIKPIFVEEVD